MSKDKKPAPAGPATDPVAEAIRSLQAELSRINERLAALESATARPAPVPAPSAPPSRAA